MRIGIDTLFLRPGKVGGSESYLRNLLKGLEDIDEENEYYIFTSDINDNTFHFKNKKFIKYKCNVSGQKQLYRILFTNFILPRDIKKLKLDIMFFPTYMRCYLNIKGVKIISNVHDIQYKHFPDYFSFSKKLIFSIFYPTSLLKSNGVVCISNHVKNDLIDNFPKIVEKKCRVIYNPINFQEINDYTMDFHELESRYGIRKDNYILSVASLLPHKNLITLIKAFSELKKRRISDIKLVLVGIKEKHTDQLLKEVKKYSLENDVVIPGFIQNEDLYKIYKNALLFVLTSLFEGFGMPPVEAMFYKIPVITTKCTSLPEVTKSLANYYNDPYDYNELCNLMLDIINTEPNKSKLAYTSQVMFECYNIKNIAKDYKNFFMDVYNN